MRWSSAMIDADDLGAGRDLDAHEPLDGDGVAQVVAHGGEVVGAVGVGQEVLVPDGLALLLEAGVQVAEVGVGGDDGLAVELDDDAQHAVGGGVVGAHVENHVAVGVGLLGRDLGDGLGLDNLLAEGLELLVFPGHGEGDGLAAAGDVLAEGVVGPGGGHEDAAEVGVAVEADAHEVVGLALGPVGAGPEGGEGGDGWGQPIETGDRRLKIAGRAP